MRYLRLFEQVIDIVDTGSIRQAAGRGNLSPSALNRKIQELEFEIGVALFERHARGVRLTAAGEKFVQYAREHIADTERLLINMGELNTLRSGHVRLACSQAVAFDFLPKRIAEFWSRYPHILFDIRVMDHQAACISLARYETELALIFKPQLVPGLAVLARVPQRLVVVMRHDHPLASQSVLRLGDCLPYPVALPDRTLGSRQLVDEACAAGKLSLNIMAESNSFEMLRGLVLRANALSFQIEISSTGDDMGQQTVTRPVDQRDIPCADLMLCQLQDRHLSMAAATFSAELTTLLGAEKTRPVTP